MTLIRASVAAPGWIATTGMTAEELAVQFVGKPVTVMGRDEGRVIEAWVENGGVTALVELDRDDIL